MPGTRGRLPVPNRRKVGTTSLRDFDPVETRRWSRRRENLVYEYDINAPANRKRIYPTNTTDYSDFIYYSNNSQCISAGLIGAQGAPSKFHSGPKELLTYIENPVITYNKSTNAYFITFIGYVDQQFKLINYSTSTRLVNRVLVTETDELILTETDCAIAVV